MRDLHRKFYFLYIIFVICVSFSVNIVGGSLSVHQRGNLDIYRKDCGQIEQCLSNNIENSKTTSNSSELSSRFAEKPLHEQNKFIRESYNCKCDKNCHEYGDCCVSKANRLTVDNPWRCNRLQDERVGALMVSTCPDKCSPHFSKLCMNEVSSANTSYNYELDIPVYSKYTKKLYKNIFCAICNGVLRHKIYPVSKKMICNFNISSEEQVNFLKQAQYERSKRSWKDGFNNKTSCEIYIPEFDETVVHETIPNIRFCGLNFIDYCPHNSNEKINSLCHSYTQHVTYRFTTKKFKNSHCAECYIDMKKKSFKIQNAVCYKYTPGIPPIPTRGTAFSLILDFSLDSSKVGYKKEKISNNKFEMLQRLRSCNTSLLKSDLNETCLEISLSENEFEILENGALIINSSIFEQHEQNDQQMKFSENEYELINDTSTTTFFICTYSTEQKNSTEILKETFSKHLINFSVVVLSISVICSALHMILYILLPKLRNPPGRNLFCLTLCLFASQLLFITLDRSENRILCVSVAITLHFLFLASFFWMNVLAFDIWRTFSLEFLVKRHSNDSNRVFAIYNIYAWLCPAIVVFCSVLTDFAFDTNDFEDDNGGTLFYIVKKIRPMYGFNNTCFIGQGFSLLVFFAIPVAILILTNLILFVSTAYSIYKQHRESEIVLKTNDARTTCSPTPSSATARKSNEILLKLYWKLALIMGLTWILGFIANKAFIKNPLTYEVLQYLFTFFNASQGTFIFLAFDCKKKVWNMLRERLSLTKSRTDSSQNTGRQKGTNTTSAGSSSSGSKNKSN